jgi:serine O-acetyltransferase
MSQQKNKDNSNKLWSSDQGISRLWKIIVDEVTEQAENEPELVTYFHDAILSHHSLETALAYNLALKLDSNILSSITISQVFTEALMSDSGITDKICMDLAAYVERDPACDRYSLPLLYFKGFHALQIHRIAHWLWNHDRESLALYLQNRVSEVFAVDIHPAAQIGGGIMIDHATGLVVGETTVIGDNVSMLHSVTLGGTGAEAGDRHPKIHCGVLIAAGAKILGNIEVGEGAKIGAGSLVLEPVPAHTTVAGVPAEIVGHPTEAEPAREMDQRIDG